MSRSEKSDSRVLLGLIVKSLKVTCCLCVWTLHKLKREEGIGKSSSTAIISTFIVATLAPMIPIISTSFYLAFLTGNAIIVTFLV